MPTERELIAKAQDGDIEARDSLINHDHIRKQCSKYFGQTSEYMDFCQEAVFGWFRAIRDYDLTTQTLPLEAYAYNKVRGAINDYLNRRDPMVRTPQSLRKTQRYVPVKALPFSLQARIEPDYSDLHECIQLLPEQSQEIIRLKYLEQKPYREIGQLVGLSHEAMRLRLNKAIKELRKIYVA